MKIFLITASDLFEGAPIYRPTARSVNPRRQGQQGVGDIWDDFNNAFFGGGNDGANLPNPQITIDPGFNWLNVADGVLKYYKSWQVRDNINQQCVEIINQFWGNSDSWLTRFTALIPTLCSNKVSDQQIMAVFNQTCSTMLARLNEIARRYDNDHCRVGIRERPCYDKWKIGDRAPFEGPNYWIQQALQQRRQAEASGALNCPPPGTGSGADPVTAVDWEKYLLYAAIAIGGILILKKVLS